MRSVTIPVSNGNTSPGVSLRSADTSPHPTGGGTRQRLAWSITLVLAIAAGGFFSVEAETVAASGFPQLVQRAKDARDGNNLDEAASLYALALRQRPSWTEGWWYLGSIQYKQHRFAPALESFRRVSTLSPKRGAAFALMGLCEYELGQYTSALKHLDRGGALGSGEDQELTPVILYHVALLLTRLGEFERSSDQLAMFVAAGNHTSDTVVALGLCALRMPLVPSEIPVGKHELVAEAGEAAWQFNAHNVEDAKKLYAALVAKYPNEPNVHFAFGTYLLESDPQLAYEEFQKELSISPTHNAARLQVAFFDLQRGSPEEAMQLAQQVLPSSPKDYRVHLVLGRGLLQLNEIVRAVPELKLAAALSPDDFEPRFYLAQAYRKAGDTLNATREQAEFDRLKNENTRQTSMAGWWYFAGQYYKNRRFQEARDALKKITAQNGKDSAAWAMMGLCDFELKDYGNALDHLTRARRTGLPVDSEMVSALHYYRAILLDREGSFEDGLKELSWFAGRADAAQQTIEAVGINALRMKLLPAEVPTERHDLVMKAGAAGWAFDLGHLAEAKVLFQELAAAYPEEPNVHYGYGLCLSSSNDAVGARQEFQRALQLEPSHGDAESQLAFVDLKQGSREPALQEAEAAARMAPDSFLSHNALGWALLANGQLDRAIEEMRTSARLAPDTPVTHFSLAQAYKAAGKSADAQKEMTRFETLNAASKPGGKDENKN